MSIRALVIVLVVVVVVILLFVVISVVVLALEATTRARLVVKGLRPLEPVRLDLSLLLLVCTLGLLEDGEQLFTLRIVDKSAYGIGCRVIWRCTAQRESWAKEGWSEYAGVAPHCRKDGMACDGQSGSVARTYRTDNLARVVNDGNGLLERHFGGW